MPGFVLLAFSQLEPLLPSSMRNPDCSTVSSFWRWLRCFRMSEFCVWKNSIKALRVRPLPVVLRGVDITKQTIESSRSRAGVELRGEHPILPAALVQIHDPEALETTELPEAQPTGRDQLRKPPDQRPRVDRVHRLGPSAEGRHTPGAIAPRRLLPEEIRQTDTDPRQIDRDEERPLAMDRL